ncbi:ABC transporter ATP-binding protein [Candidatus Synechococcus calcipolaris G9]|uniref:ABC transporter ATP-binding protein n=1 Tax=Candidatus Synechococcus calcipolaris G9 TaxID=1497997 RepID=A0ABT6F0L5_9SYNE|nr:ABC transporter ATP-binding protein [Candidatus Synechococcus calcipolaris]MDG2991366.1 ABC transporter ATP-binding protein [Candidatus Synechococcus calcipolaris G9]
MARVCLEQVSRRFGGTAALDRVNFEVPDGEFWVLVGPSGCGKSTILRLIAGLDQPSMGSIFIGSTRVNDQPARDRDVAMVFQNYALYPHMTVRENLGFGLKMRGMDPAAAQGRIQTVAKMLGIDSLLGRKPRQLSGGQQQRVALGRAIARNPQVFLLDEPLSNLDAQLRDDTRAELKQLHQQLGITTLYVTHDQVEAMTLADRIIVLEGGQIQQIATPKEIYERPANQMVARFLGHPPMNLFPIHLEAGRLRCGDQSLPCPPQYQSKLKPDHPYTLGIRPEHLQICFPPDQMLESQALESNKSNSMADHELYIKAQVSLVEPLGRENLVRFHLWDDADRLLSLVTTAGTNIQRGDRLCLGFSSTNLHLFDAVSGLSLCLM